MFVYREKQYNYAVVQQCCVTLAVEGSVRSLANGLEVLFSFGHV